ncbi:MAG: hypothetical protein COU71_01885 [Parcubacteria group bacterium CG10_big_fil_rev_8_21_14_0_10_38_31]|nr:MAG: hypothetical protein COU71_01885 [Parcubacteria group bacterium CG10_big_fil_rev_8_21_14_0_10_38_31]
MSDRSKNLKEVGPPLVSICTTFFNAGRYIHRALESCLNQTYKNLEVIVVDDASTDNSEEMVKKYASLDSRVKYFRNYERTGLAESEIKMFHLAGGKFAMMLGADDWLPRNYIENGVRAFLKYPDAAGIVPDLTTLIEENDSGIFTFESRKHFPQGTHSAEWFIKRMYKPEHLYISALGLVRSEDLVRAFDYYIENYYKRDSKSLPEELRSFFKRAFGMDIVTFTEILTRYRSFVFNDSLNYIKITHSQNQPFDLKRDTLFEVFKKSYYYFLIYKYIYKPKWPKFYRGMKIYIGAQTLSTAFIGFLRSEFNPSFLNISESKNLMSKFFGEYSLLEVILTAVYSIPMIIARCLSFAIRKFIRSRERKELEVFFANNFLDKEKNFRA